jgi:hypothetical protein
MPCLCSMSATSLLVHSRPTYPRLWAHHADTASASIQVNARDPAAPQPALNADTTAVGRGSCGDKLSDTTRSYCELAAAGLLINCRKEARYKRYERAKCKATTERRARPRAKCRAWRDLLIRQTGGPGLVVLAHLFFCEKQGIRR